MSEEDDFGDLFGLDPEEIVTHKIVPALTLVAGGGIGQVLNEVDKIAGALVFAGHEHPDAMDNPPQRINFYEVDLLGDGQKPNMRVISSGRKTVNSWSEVESNLKNAQSSNQFPNHTTDTFRGLKTGEQRKKGLVQLSFVPPLDEEPVVSKRVLYVIKLHNKSAQKDIRFSRTFSPFTLADLETEIGGVSFPSREFICLASQIVDPSQSAGQPTRDHLTRWLIDATRGERPAGREYPETVWACFLFDWSKIIDEHGNFPEFAIRFNMHVELRDGKVPNNFIPIIVDPDVGHPGGNHGGPPPGP